MDEYLQKLKRCAATGDSDAQAAYDLAFTKVCTHKRGTYLSMIGGLWGTGAQWCKECGFCVSDPTQPPRAEGARQHRKFTELAKKAVERLENMSAVERAEYDKNLLKKLREGREKLKEKLKPFRSRPISSRTWNRRLD